MDGAELLSNYRKTLSSNSSGDVVEANNTTLSTTSWAGAGGSSPPREPAFNPQSLRELKIQSQLQPHSEILKQLEREMSQSPQATILRRMKEEARNHEELHSLNLAKLDNEGIIQLEKEAKRRELEYLLAEEVPVTVTDMLQILAEPLDGLKGDTDEQHRERELQETSEEQQAKLRKKVALNLDSMLKYGSSTKLNKEVVEQEKSPEEEKKGSKRSHLIDFNKRTDEGVTSLRGFASISGWKIFKSELRLEVRSTWGKKLPLSVKVQVSHLAPLRMAQIQNAHNNMRMAHGELKRLHRLINRNGGKAEERSLADTFQRVRDLLQIAREELDTFEIHEFPDNLFASNGFLPALPPEVAVEFHVFQGQLILSVYILQISSVQPTKLSREANRANSIIDSSSSLSPGGGRGGRASKPHLRQPPTVGQTYVLQGKKIEIMDAIRIACDVPFIKAAVQALEQANGLADELRDKLLAVSS